VVAIPKGLDICITDNLAEHGESGVLFEAGFREGSRMANMELFGRRIC
jgi:2,3-bisphosphoglycerate-independent phosphoglycerate mutase